MKYKNKYFIVEFENGGSPFWLTGGEGDPARTVVIENAKRFNNRKDADKELLKAEKLPFRNLKGKGKILEIYETQDNNQP